jgi:hypothetical protein
MASILKREIYVSVQFLLIVLAAVVVGFFRLVTAYVPGEGEDSAVHINISEMWANEAPYVRSILLIFCVLTVLRMAVIFLVHSVRNRGG